MIPKIDSEACIGCGACVNVCPHTVFEMKDGKAIVAHPEKCDELWACLSICPVQAITKTEGDKA